MTLPGFHECPECGGDGKLYHHNPFAFDPPKDGPDDWSPCAKCGGAGQVPDDDTVERVADGLRWHVPESDRLIAARAALLAYARHVQQPSNL